jgi:hypothetical protein
VHPAQIVKLKLGNRLVYDLHGQARRVRERLLDDRSAKVKPHFFNKSFDFNML